MNDAAPSIEFAISWPLDLGHGPLRVVVKECLDIAGLPTRMGSGALADAPPATAHAAVVHSVIDHGCHIIGRANMHELAFGLTGINSHLGTPANPHWRTLSPEAPRQAPPPPSLRDFAISPSARTPADRSGCRHAVVGSTG